MDALRACCSAECVLTAPRILHVCPAERRTVQKLPAWEPMPVCIERLQCFSQPANLITVECAPAIGDQHQLSYLLTSAVTLKP